MSSSPFDWSAAEIEAAYKAFSNAIGPWWENLSTLNPSGLAHDPATHGVRPEVNIYSDNRPPENGLDLAVLIQSVIKDLGSDSQVVGHPHYLAYVAGAANPVAPIGQALSMMLNPYTGTFATAPRAVQLEDQTIRWLMTMMNWPDAGTGLLTTGSSLAIFSAVLAAREARVAPQGKRRVYVSDQAHHCFGKALFGAGFLPEETIVIPSDKGRLNPERAREAIRRDKSSGLTPVMLVGTAGTTNLGRVDPLDDLADICRDEDLWFHVDGAYGGFFKLLGEATVLKGLERGDSLSLDPHKAFSMPYGTGALLVRDVKSITWPRGLNASYMPPFSSDHMRLEYSDITPELSRDFRGLRLWLSIKHFGLEIFRQHLLAKWKQARYLAERFKETGKIELVSDPDLSLFAWKLKNDLDGNRSRRLFQAINSSGHFFVTACEWEKTFVIRTCILGFRTEMSDLDEFVKLILTLEAKV
ncbi:MAG: pyridoxal-dependent decarboxylase [Bdellovibrionota bacterium]